MIDGESELAGTRAPHGGGAKGDNILIPWSEFRYRDTR